MNDVAVGKWLRVEGGRGLKGPKFLIFDLRFLIEGEEESKAGGTPLRPKVMEGCGGKRWVGKWVRPGKGGRIAGKQTGFSHVAPALTRLFPDVSTQVVDFPHLAHVSQAELGTSIGNGVLEYRNVGGGVERGGRAPSARLTSHVRILVVIFATERSLMFA
jgi:hypothetical protein